MDKDKIILSIAIGFVCVILIAIMFTQFKTIDEADIVGITTAREDELTTMLATWKQKQAELQEQLDSTRQRIDEYNEKISSNQAAEELLQDELEQTNMLTGQTDVEGEGIVLTLSDAERSVTYEDLLELINELRGAGAEAISINDQRIINMTEIVDANAILVNQERVVSPYIVKAIGGITYLTSAINQKNIGFVDVRRGSGINVQLEESKNVKISAYSGRRSQLEFRYAKEVEE